MQKFFRTVSCFLLGLMAFFLVACNNAPQSNTTVKNLPKNPQSSSSASQDSRPGGVPDYLPSLPNAKEFNWYAASAQDAQLSFWMDGNDYSTVCDQEKSLLTNAGWFHGTNAGDKYTSEMDDHEAVKSYEMGSDSKNLHLQLTCSLYKNSIQMDGTKKDTVEVRLLVQGNS